MNRQSTEDCLGSRAILCDTTVVDTYHCTFVKTHRMHNNESEP